MSPDRGTPPGRRAAVPSNHVSGDAQGHGTAVRVLPARTPYQRGADRHFELYVERGNKPTVDEQFEEHAEAIARLEREVDYLRHRVDELAAFVVGESA